MRMLCFILGSLGFVWAFMGLGGICLTVMNIAYIETAGNAVYCLATILLFISGYFIWFGWWFYVRKERFPLLSVRGFWLLSLIHHISCILYLIPMDVWGGGDDPFWVPTWIVGNALIAGYYVFTPSKKPSEAA